VSDTPRTDAASWREHQQSVVDADFARELERELAAMQKQRDEARRWVCRLLANPTWATGTAKPFKGTAQCFAKEQGWDCFKEGGGA
jgi:hypothetical protein